MRRHAISCLWFAVWLAASGCDDDGGNGAADLGADADGGADSDGGGDLPDAAPDLEPEVEADVGDGDTGDDADAAGDAGEDVSDVPIQAEDFEAVEHTPRNPAVPVEGHEDVSAALEAGEVRAGVVASWEHGFGGIEVDCRPGDYKMYNARVQFCIAGEEPINLFTYAGGQVVDADRVGAADDRLFMLTPHASFSVPNAETIEVLEDGRNGSAVIRVAGPEAPFRLISDLVGMVFPPRGVTFETEYRLVPDVDYLEIVTWLRPVAGAQRVSFGEVALLGDTSVNFTPGFGRERADEGEAYPFLAATTESRSYALYRPDGWENMSIDFSEVLSGDYNVIVGLRGLLPEGSEGALRRYLIVGDGGTNDIRTAIAAIEGDGPEAGALFTTRLDGAVVGDVTVVIHDGDGRPIDVVHSDESPVRLGLPPGDYTAQPEGWAGGGLEGVPFTVGVGEDVPVELDLPEPARLVLDITTENEAGDPVPSPAKIRVLNAVSLPGARGDLLFVSDGTLDHLMRPGTYRLEISRGEAFDVEVVTDLALVAGDNAPIEVELDRLWDTGGYIAGEFHQHMTSSPDSIVSDRDRVLSNLVEGVDFVVPTDHEAVTDLTPVIEALGIEDLLYAMPSTEISPLYGHLNAMPMVWDPALPAAGAYQKAEVDIEAWTLDRFQFPRIVSDLRAMDVPVIQVNHPRDGFALFDSGRYDPVAGPDAAAAGRFSTDFDTLEVYNTRSEFCDIVDDWIGLIARGIHITGVGNSDTHSLSSPAGYPRNYLASDATPADMEDADIVDALLSGNVTVSGGALITFPGGPAFGSLHDVSGGNTFDLPVLLQTPTFGAVDELLVILDGDIAAQIAIDEVPEQVVDYDDTVELALPDHDTYVFAVAWGADPLQLVYPGERPFGFTNPVYLDVDGDGSWTPPGIASAEDLPDIQIPWCE